MKQIIEKITIALFLAFLFAMTLGVLLLPKADFSAAEKRYLSKFPAASWADISSGQWGEDLETYMADHLPGRTFFVGLNAYKDLLLGQQADKDVHKVGNRLVEAPVTFDEAVIARNMNALNTFAKNLGQDVAMTLVPSAGWAMGAEGYLDTDILRSAFASAGDGVKPIDISDAFAGNPDLYYRTDHHWTSAGAHAGYTALMGAMGRDARQDFDIELLPDCFQGSTYSRSALWFTPAEDLELWHGSDITVTNAESGEAHDGVFYRNRLEEADKYTVFLDGNHSLVRLVNPQKTGKLLVIRDSYSNCLGCFLAESYGEVVLVDLRYYKQPVSLLASQENFDDILFCYSVGNFMTDTNIVWLR